MFLATLSFPGQPHVAIVGVDIKNGKNVCYEKKFLLNAELSSVSRF
jgi:hypothetical protein